MSGDRSVWGCFKTNMFAVFRSHGYFSDSTEFIHSFQPCRSIFLSCLSCLVFQDCTPFLANILHTCRHPNEIFADFLCDCLKKPQEKIRFSLRLFPVGVQCPSCFPENVGQVHQMILLFMMLVYSFFFNLLVSYFGQDLPMCFFLGGFVCWIRRGKDVCLGFSNHKITSWTATNWYTPKGMCSMMFLHCWVLLIHQAGCFKICCFRDFHLGKIQPVWLM